MKVKAKWFERVEYTTVFELPNGIPHEGEEIERDDVHVAIDAAEAWDSSNYEQLDVTDREVLEFEILEEGTP